MSYFPQKAPGSTVGSMKGLAAFAARIDCGTGVRGAVAGPFTQTTAAFVVPVLGASVTVNVGSSANFVAGDYVMVGTRAMILTTPVHATTGPGALTFSGRYQQGRAVGATVAPVGYSLIGPAGQRTTLTATIGSLPDFINITTASITVADRAQIPSNSWVKLTNYAGVYRVTSIPGGTSLQLTYVTAGDLPAGATCVQDTSGSDTGAFVTQFYPLGVVPKGFILTYTDGWVATVSVTGATASTPNISIGFNPNTWTSGPTTRMGEYVNNTGQYAGTVVGADFAFNVVGDASNTSADRITPMDGMAFGVRVNTPTSTSFIQDVCLRGLLVPFV